MLGGGSQTKENLEKGTFFSDLLLGCLMGRSSWGEFVAFTAPEAFDSRQSARVALIKRWKL